MQTTAIDTRPDQINVIALGGDTLTITVVAPDSVVAGLEWSAQVRVNREDETAAADFNITPPEVPDGPATLMLTSAVTAALAAGGAVLTTKFRDGTTRSIQQFSGVWDCQVAGVGGIDPVTTLVQGTLVLEMDVTRP